jgi:hypothetical protein
VFNDEAVHLFAADAIGKSIQPCSACVPATTSDSTRNLAVIRDPTRGSGLAKSSAAGHLELDIEIKRGI